MFHVRTTKTASLATAVQIVRYDGKRTIVVRHIGSAKTQDEIKLLKDAAADFIAEQLMVKGQQRLFPSEKKNSGSKIIQLDKCAYLGVRYSFIYEALSHVAGSFGFVKLDNKLLLDLVFMRIIEPSSKLQALSLLHDLFGLSYTEITLYRSLKQFAKLKETIEQSVVSFAKKRYAFDFSFVFYDVTTLYYESFTEDEDRLDADGNVINKGLRKNGFGKEIKHGQPIIVIGLMVTKEGFPITYEVYEGNTFEGDTFIPSILSFKKKYNLQTLTIVADAAMISFDNIEKLKKHTLSYIVGARMANLKYMEMQQVNEELVGQSKTAEELQKIDGKATRIQTEKGLLICDFSLKRYKKDKREMEKQIARAEYLLAQNEGIRRTKYLKNKDKEKTKQELNTKLIERTKLLLGIKGYYTNLFEKDEKLTNADIINHYHSLWHVEKAFRIAKSDLQMRPIYHFKRQTIEAHILICFMALTMCKHMELKTKQSTKKIVKLLKSITEARIKNLLTGEIFTLKQQVPEEVEQLRRSLGF